MVRKGTNRDVVEAFLSHQRGMTNNLSTDGKTLFSYMLPIAGWSGGEVEVLVPGYVSRTTSRHLGLLRARSRALGIRVIEPVPTR